MAYIGRDVAYGVLDTQTFAPDGNAQDFALDYTVGSETSILVVSDGVVLQPVTDYTIQNGGTELHIVGAAPANTVVLFAIFMGLAVTIQTVGDNTITPQKLTAGVRKTMMHDEVYSTVTGSFTASPQTHYYMAQTGAITVNLPANPAFGDKVMITKISTSDITVARNGSNINDNNANVTISARFQPVSLTFVDATVGWVSSGPFGV